MYLVHTDVVVVLNHIKLSLLLVPSFLDLISQLTVGNCSTEANCCYILTGGTLNVVFLSGLVSKENHRDNGGENHHETIQPLVLSYIVCILHHKTAPTEVSEAANTPI